MTEAQSLQAVWAELESAFGRAGIQSYLLEGVVGEMQRCAGEYLAMLAPDMHLALTATSTTGGGGVAERIDKVRASLTNAFVAYKTLVGIDMRVLSSGGFCAAA